VKAYVIGEIDVTDAVAYEEYRKKLAPVNAKYGGKFLVRAGKVETLDGDWKPERLVVIEFPSKGKALAWFRSPEFEPLQQMRRKASRGKLVLVEGT
jgi:uncharacterized protein (DUF1330 family)